MTCLITSFWSLTSSLEKPWCRKNFCAKLAQNSLRYLRRQKKITKVGKCQAELSETTWGKNILAGTSSAPKVYLQKEHIDADRRWCGNLTMMMWQPGSFESGRHTIRGAWCCFIGGRILVFMIGWSCASTSYFTPIWCRWRCFVLPQGVLTTWKVPLYEFFFQTSLNDMHVKQKCSWVGGQDTGSRWEAIRYATSFSSSFSLFHFQGNSYARSYQLQNAEIGASDELHTTLSLNHGVTPKLPEFRK